MTQSLLIFIFHYKLYRYIQTLFTGTQTMDIFTQTLTHQLSGNYLLFSAGWPRNRGEVVRFAFLVRKLFQIIGSKIGLVMVTQLYTGTKFH